MNGLVRWGTGPPFVCVIIDVSRVADASEKADMDVLATSENTFIYSLIAAQCDL